MFWNSHKILGVSFKESEMPRPGVPSLDQLAVFLAVVETGSFAAAARRLGRATSAVSYAIAVAAQQCDQRRSASHPRSFQSNQTGIGQFRPRRAGGRRL